MGSSDGEDRPSYGNPRLYGWSTEDAWDVEGTYHHKPRHSLCSVRGREFSHDLALIVLIIGGVVTLTSWTVFVYAVHLGGIALLMFEAVVVQVVDVVSVPNGGVPRIRL